MREPIEPVLFPAPALLGLNKEQSENLLGPEWATEAQNIVIDSSGRAASRKGWDNQTTSAMSGTPNIEALHEYKTAAGVVTLIASAGNKLWESSDNGATWTDRTAALTVTASKYQFVNFNGKCIAAQSGHPILVKTSGNFALISASSGSVPTNPVAILAAYGRLWAIESDLQTIKYCALLDETKWAVADGGGTIDLRNVWSKGIDTAVAMVAFSSRFVVFGTQQTILWVDGRGNQLGLSPLDMYVEDVIETAGTIARDSVQNIGEGDVMFLSQNGIQSLARVIEEKQTPIVDVTKNIRQWFNIRVQNSAVDKTKIRSVYSPQEGFYLLSVPDANLTICVDVRVTLEDGTNRIFEWPSFIPRSMVNRTNGDLLFGFAGVVGKHTGYSDNGTPYWYVLRSAYLNMEDLNLILKILKRIKVISSAPSGQTITVKWWWDYGREVYNADIEFEAGSGVSEYGEAEYGTAQYGGALIQRIDTVPGGGSGQFFKMGIEALIDGSPFSLQILQAYYDKGRLA